jgi:Ice-binding-like
MKNTNPSKAAAALLLMSLVAACGSSDAANADGGAPGGADGATAGGDAAAVDGGAGQDAATLPDADSADSADAADGANAASPGAVGLGAAGTFALLAKSGISTVPTSAIVGDVGVSPAAATYLTGFSETADATNVFSTAPQVTGKIYASDYAMPTPAILTAAIGAMQTAFADAAGRAPGVTELGAGNIGGKTLTPGVYKWGTGLMVPTDVTLTGSATDVWIFQIAQDLTVASAAKVVLAGGALPKNVFWQVAGRVEVGTTAHLEGVVLSLTAIALRTGASINGRLLAQTAISVDASAIVQPAP